MLKSAMMALAAMSATAFGVPHAVPNNGRHITPLSKYSPSAPSKGRSGDKLRRKARERKLGIAVLR